METAAIFTDREELKDSLMYVDMSRCMFYTTDQLTSFNNSQHKVKIAIIEPNYYDTSRLQDELLQFEHCDLVIVYSMEMNRQIFDTVSMIDKDNYKFVVNGVLNHSMKSSEIFSDITWFYSTAFLYQNIQTDIMQSKLSPFSKKQYAFDVMYGTPKKHRKFVYNYLQSSQHFELFYQTPFFDNNKNTRRAYHLDKTDLWEDGMIPNPSSSYICTYLGKEMLISQVLPFKIYNKTNYSLICETSYLNQFSFFTEKTVKAILAHRLFVIISGRWFLRNLKTLGFKTFDSIIDESYDEVEDDQQRWTMALQQAEWLCSQDWHSVSKKIIPIAIHNYEILKRMPVNTLSKLLETELLIRGFYR